MNTVSKEISEAEVLSLLPNEFTTEDIFGVVQDLSKNKRDTIGNYQWVLNKLIESGKIRHLENLGVYIKCSEDINNSMTLISEIDLLNLPEMESSTPVTESDFRSKQFISLGKNFTLTDVKEISKDPNRLVKTWIKKGVIKEISEGNYEKVTSTSIISNDEKIDEEVIIVNPTTINTPEDPIDLIDQLVDRLIEKLLFPNKNKLKTWVYYSEEIRSSEDKSEINKKIDKFNKLGTEITKRLKTKIINDRLLIFPTHKIGFNLVPRPDNPVAIDLCLSEENISFVNIRFKEYVDEITNLPGGLTDLKNLEYMIRFLGRNLNYFKTNGSYYFKRFQGLIATYEITYKMCIDNYYKLTGTYVFSVGSCTYCKDGKYLSFLTKDAADQYIRDFKYSAYSSQLRNFDNPEELKLLSRSYFSTDCGCYHITSQPQNSENKIKDLLTMTEYAMSEFSDEYYVNSIDYKKKILQYFKQKIQEKLDSCSETDSIRQEFISILEKLNKDLNQLILGSLSNVDIEKDSSEVKEVSAKAQESPTPSKTVSSEFDGILNDIYDLIVNEFILGDYENCLEMIEKTEQAIYNRTKPWIKKNLKDIHTLLGKISWIKLRILNEQN